MPLPTPIRIIKAILILASFALGLSLYLDISNVQSEVNDDPSRSDQHAYLAFAKNAYDSQLGYTGDRNFMPLFPWIQALSYSPHMNDKDFFEQGKQVNVLISLVSLLALGIVFYCRFAKLYAIYALLVTAFLFFSIKAPFFQPDILFYSIFSLAFFLSIESILRPKWYKSAGVGLLFALAHFTKASAVLGLVIFTCSFAVPFLAELFSGRLSLRRLRIILCHAVAPSIVFFIALHPYFAESKERYGQYLYNRTTTFYLWSDSWGAAKAGPMAAGDKHGWPNMPEEELPSPAKYLANHSVSEIVHRIRFGAERFLYRACTYTKGHSRLGYCSHVGAGLVILCACLAFCLTKLRSWMTPINAQLVVYVTGIHIIYLLLSFFAWPITAGPRVTLTLLIPLFWTVGLLLESIRNSLPSIKLMGRRIQLWRIIYLALVSIALFQIYELAAFRAATLYGGK